MASFVENVQTNKQMTEEMRNSLQRNLVYLNQQVRDISTILDFMDHFCQIFERSIFLPDQRERILSGRITREIQDHFYSCIKTNIIVYYDIHKEDTQTNKQKKRQIQ